MWDSDRWVTASARWLQKSSFVNIDFLTVPTSLAINSEPSSFAKYWRHLDCGLKHLTTLTLMYAPSLGLNPRNVQPMAHRVISISGSLSMALRAMCVAAVTSALCPPMSRTTSLCTATSGRGCAADCVVAIVYYPLIAAMMSVCATAAIYVIVAVGVVVVIVMLPVVQFVEDRRCRARHGRAMQFSLEDLPAITVLWRHYLQILPLSVRHNLIFSVLSDSSLRFPLACFLDRMSPVLFLAPMLCLLFSLAMCLLLVSPVYMLHWLVPSPGSLLIVLEFIFMW